MARSAMGPVIEALRTLRVGVVLEEYDLQDQIASILDGAGISYVRECRLGKGHRVDFLTWDGIAIEAKKGKPNRTHLAEQINRYATYQQVKAVIVVVETSLREFAQTANGKPCFVLGLQKLWGISL